VRTLDRDSVIGALRSGADADREVRQVADDVRAIVRREVRSSKGDRHQHPACGLPVAVTNSLSNVR
jgi:hypothetical protein